MPVACHRGILVGVAGGQQGSRGIEGRRQGAAEGQRAVMAPVVGTGTYIRSQD